MPVKFSLTGERRRLESNYNSAEGVFLTLTLAYFARVAMGHLWYNSGTKFVGSVSASTLRDYPSARTIRTLNHLPLDSRLRLPSKTYFILAGAQPELSYSASWSVSRPDQLRERHTFNMNRKRLQESVLNRHRRSHCTLASLRPVFIQIKPGSFPR
jgi:hypothetical protein